MPHELTEIQKKILDYLIDQIKGKGIPPTLAEAAKHFGYKNRATVQQHLGAIEKRDISGRILNYHAELNLHLKINFLCLAQF